MGLGLDGAGAFSEGQAIQNGKNEKGKMWATGGLVVFGLGLLGFAYWATIWTWFLSLLSSLHT